MSNSLLLAVHILRLTKAWLDLIQLKEQKDKKWKKNKLVLQYSIDKVSKSYIETLFL